MRPSRRESPQDPAPLRSTLERQQRGAESIELDALTCPRPLAVQHQPFAKILIIDDDRTVRGLLEKALTRARFECSSNGNPRAALATLASGTSEPTDLIILDMVMPEMGGRDFLSRLRELGNETPILVLSGSGQINDRVELLRLGADDFLAKPFSMQELIARVNAILRRTWSMPVVTLGDLRVHLLEQRVELCGHSLDLSPTEFKLLRVLLEARGRPVSCPQLLAKVWDYHFDPRTNLVQVHIARLRRKLEGSTSPRIETVPGKGYGLLVPAHETPGSRTPESRRSRA
jgi:two-component system, OmpR family, response regulator